jgi:transcriptional regulator with XRE-family HTH domain
MGRNRRIQPNRLAEKLKAVREKSELTAEQLIERLNCPQIPLHRASITEYEKGRREPPSLVLLAYARLANIPVEILIDDDLDLPN